MESTHTLTKKQMTKFYEAARYSLRVASLLEHDVLAADIGTYASITEQLKEATGVNLRQFIHCCDVMNIIYEKEAKKIEDGAI